ncbi:MAG: HEAT repeat domain-containing protein [Bacillota bacterium]
MRFFFNTVLVLLLMLTPALAELSKLAPSIEPLPYEMVDVLFDKIERKEKNDLQLLHQALQGPQYTLRALAATELGNQGNETSIPFLIDALSDDSMHVGATYIEPGMATTRYRANESLKKLTGEDFGFIWNDPKDKRKEAIEGWHKWYLDKKRAIGN